MPEKLEESPWAKVIAVVGGAGLSAGVASQIQKVAPQLSEELAGAGAGVVAYLYGDRVHPLVKWVGIGLMAGSLMPRVSGWLGGLIPTTTPPPSTTGTGSSAALALAKAYAGAY